MGLKIAVFVLYNRRIAFSGVLKASFSTKVEFFLRKNMYFICKKHTKTHVSVHLLRIYSFCNLCIPIDSALFAHFNRFFALLCCSVNFHYYSFKFLFKSLAFYWFIRFTGLPTPFPLIKCASVFAFINHTYHIFPLHRVYYFACLFYFAFYFYTNWLMNIQLVTPRKAFNKDSLETFTCIYFSKKQQSIPPQQSLPDKRLQHYGIYNYGSLGKCKLYNLTTWKSWFHRTSFLRAAGIIMFG